MYHLQLVSVEDAVQLILELGVDAYMAKLEIRQAYHNVPVYPIGGCLVSAAWVITFLGIELDSATMQI